MAATNPAVNFDRAFEDLTGAPPLPWQRRLYGCFLADNLPDVCDLPTGLGKTMVMAIWLIARTVNEKLPRRLVYVVDRRTVVDQATDLAERLEKNLPNAMPQSPSLKISTLRGQLADNREWSRDPSQPAIIIGTVDLIGSALLFSGYRSSYKRRPLEAGLLGQDSLLVLDEAQLSKPFEKLICAIGSDGPFQKDCDGAAHGMPMRVMRMSATSDCAPATKIFSLQIDANGDLTGEDANGITQQRFESCKNLKIKEPVESKNLNAALADAAIELATDNTIVGKRIVVFVRKPDDAQEIVNQLRKHVVESVDDSGAKPKKSKSTPFSESVEVLTGTMRGLERDKLVEQDVFKDRWLKGELEPADLANQVPVFLVSTSAGEVGFDLNADHMVSDLTTIDSFIQRLGRVNRRGLGAATVVLIPDANPADKSDIDKARIATASLLANDMDVSPKALAKFKKSLKPEQWAAATSPAPGTVELTDILLDAWSLTSITERMPGRPDVAPWLRGIDDEQAQTTIAWRAELDVPGFGDLAREDIEEWFDTHRILTHETLSAPTHAVAKWFVERWNELPAVRKSELETSPVIVDRAGLKLVNVHALADQLSRKGGDFAAAIRNANLVVPASFGGVDRRSGLLDASCLTMPVDTASDSEDSPETNIDSPCQAADVADARERYRELVFTVDDEQVAKPLGSGKSERIQNAIRFSIELEVGDDKRLQLVSYVPKWEKLEPGAIRQSLSEHVDLVCQRLDEILARLKLPEPLKSAASFAAQYHDHGKNRARWQRLVGGRPTTPGQGWLDYTIGKSGGSMRRDPRGYRHEFGSLRELCDAFETGQLCDEDGNPISAEVFDLTMHLIATHHGRGRPHFPKGAFDPDAESRSDEVHFTAIRRFARLQRKYGWWQLAWLENLLRCADALASSAKNSDGVKATKAGHLASKTI
ncbi:MAG: type I-U CRISPR-associated helicase/endonuclease Cas3 [Pirellulales bacterium]|nr:type I-U CRISPR-associated helicase/endonuclease Cas3 [Pirellulales bacterium]